MGYQLKANTQYGHSADNVFVGTVLATVKTMKNITKV